MEDEIDISNVKIDKLQFSVLVYYSRIAELSQESFYTFILDLTKIGVTFSEKILKKLPEISRNKTERVKFISEILIKLRKAIKNEN
ncbi:MAG: hypothetical protein QXX68_03535 [Candidatus Pacearchaeota archaeon]